jgi:hypothetical protein
MNGFVHVFLNQFQAEEVLLLCKKHNESTVAKMYEEYPQVTLYCVDDVFDFFIRDDPMARVRQFAELGYQYVGVGSHSGDPNYLKLDPCWANCFYKQYQMDPTIRWTHWRLPKNIPHAESNLTAIVNALGPDYVILHDDPSRNFVLQYEAVKQLMKKDGTESLPILYLGKNRYKYPLIQGFNNPEIHDVIQVETLYDYALLLMNAKGCHMMDSSVALLLDFLPCRQDQMRYMHEYAKVGEILSTEGLFQKQWIRLKDQ